MSVEIRVSVVPMIRDKLSSKPSVSRFLDEWLVKNAKEKDLDYVRTPFYFHPSSFRLDCLRKLQFTYLRSLFLPEFILSNDTIFNSDARMIRILGNGNGMHDRWMNYFKESGILVEAERKFRDETLRFSGSIDDIIELNGKTYIVELKSINHFGFQKLTAPKEEHMLQLQIYCMQEGIDGFVIYENKNTQDVKEFFVESSPSIQAEIKSTVEHVIESVKESKLADKTQVFGMCQECDYQDLCFRKRIETLEEILVETYREELP